MNTIYIFNHKKRLVLLLWTILIIAIFILIAIHISKPISLYQIIGINHIKTIEYNYDLEREYHKLSTHETNVIIGMLSKVNLFKQSESDIKIYWGGSIKIRIYGEHSIIDMRIIGPNYIKIYRSDKTEYFYDDTGIIEKIASYIYQLSYQ